jgi:hypothetical protein
MCADKEYQERAEAILSLKGSIRDATTELITSNERRAKQRAKKVEAQAAERADIKAAGGNPDGMVMSSLAYCFDICMTDLGHASQLSIVHLYKARAPLNVS